MDCFFLHLLRLSDSKQTKNMNISYLYRCLLTLISSILAIINKYFTFYQICYFWRCKTSDLRNIAWNFLSVTNERACIALLPLQEVTKTNKTLQARQQFELFFSRKQRFVLLRLLLVLSTFWFFFTSFMLRWTKLRARLCVLNADILLWPWRALFY